MLDRIIAFSLRNRVLVIVIAVAIGLIGAWTAATLPGRRAPRPEPPHRHDHDRGARHGARGRGALRHALRRAVRERRHRRAPGAFELGHGPVDRLRGVRLGHRHLPQPADRPGEAPARAVEPARGDRAPDGADLELHGADPAGRDPQPEREDGPRPRSARSSTSRSSSACSLSAASPRSRPRGARRVSSRSSSTPRSSAPTT